MRILWCERHKLQAREPDHCEDGNEDAPRDDWCVVVPMRLIPDNTELEGITTEELVVALIDRGVLRQVGLPGNYVAYWKFGPALDRETL